MEAHSISEKRLATTRSEYDSNPTLAHVFYFSHISRI